MKSTQENPHDLEKTIQNLHEMRQKDRTLIYLLLLVIVLAVCAGAVAYILSAKEFLKIREDQHTEHKLTNQFLLSTIDWSALRTKMLLFMRDKIVETWKKNNVKIDMNEAYIIAESDVKVCEKFPYMDPFLLLALQHHESRFLKHVVSSMGARGINQIMPSSGRLLCAALGYSYSDSLLVDVNTSTIMAVKYLDVLYSQYNRWDLVLADYSGGPSQAYSFEKNRTISSDQTQKYVFAILCTQKKLVDEFKKYRGDSKLLSYGTETLVSSE